MGEEEFLQAVFAIRGKLYRIAMMLLWNEQDAADAIQEAMLKGWKKRRGLRDTAQFEAWFTRILINQCRDIQRGIVRGRRLLERSGEQLRLDAGASRDGELLEAIHALPDELRLPVLLYYFEGWPQAEVAGMLDINTQQVKNRLRQARQLLKKELLKGEDGDE